MNACSCDWIHNLGWRKKMTTGMGTHEGYPYSIDHGLGTHEGCPY